MCNYFKIYPLVKEKKSFKSFSIFSSSGHHVQRSETVCAILVLGHSRNIPHNYLKIRLLAKAEKTFKGFFSICSSGGHFVQRSETV